MNIVIKWLVGTYCYTHRLVHFSAFIREAASFTRLELTRDAQVDNVQRVRNLKTLSPKCDVFIKPLPENSGIYAKEHKNIVRARGGRWCEGNRDFQTQQDGCTYEFTQRTWMGSKQTKPQPSKGNWPQSPTTKQFAIDPVAKKLSVIYQWYIIGYINDTLRTGLGPEVAGQHKTF